MVVGRQTVDKYQYAFTVAVAHWSRSIQLTYIDPATTGMGDHVWVQFPMWIIILTRLPSNLRPATHDCVHLVMHGHFRSGEKDGGHNIRFDVAKNHK